MSNGPIKLDLARDIEKLVKQQPALLAIVKHAVMSAERSDEAARSHIGVKLTGTAKKEIARQIVKALHVFPDEIELIIVDALIEVIVFVTMNVHKVFKKQVMTYGAPDGLKE